MTVIQRVNIFFREVYVELRKTNWLSRRELIRYTLLVLAATIVVAGFLGGLDYAFSFAIQKLIAR